MPMGVKTVSTPNRAISSIRCAMVKESLGEGVMTGVWGGLFPGARVDGFARGPYGARMPESPPKRTGIFAPFEWMIAARYLRAKRQESFISVISLFSLIGIALGVATLIIVMSVMNGFRAELLKSILGLSGQDRKSVV